MKIGGNGAFGAGLEHMRDLVEQYSGFGGKIVAQIVADGQSDPVVAREFRARFHYGRRAVVREALEEWRCSGEIPADTNIEMLMDVLYGPIYMRLMLGHAPLDSRFMIDYQRYVFPLLGVPAPADVIVPSLSVAEGE